MSKWTYKENAEAINRWLSNVKKLEVCKITVVEPGTISIRQIRAMLKESVGAFLACDEKGLFIKSRRKNGLMTLTEFVK